MKTFANWNDADATRQEIKMALTIKIEKLEHVLRAGDWHDKALKWGVFGPFEELQYFSTKADAQAYRRVRRNSDNQIHAMRDFARLP